MHGWVAEQGWCVPCLKTSSVPSSVFRFIWFGEVHRGAARVTVPGNTTIQPPPQPTRKPRRLGLKRIWNLLRMFETCSGNLSECLEYAWVIVGACLGQKTKIISPVSEAVAGMRMVQPPGMQRVWGALGPPVLVRTFLAGVDLSNWTT